MSPSPERDRAGGFTLLEVLIALVVLAIALGALIKSTGEGARVAAHLRDVTLAHTVAMNRMAQLRLSGEYPAVGTRSGSMRVGAREWPWRLQVESTGQEDIRRATVEVIGPGGGKARLAAFIANPSPAAVSGADAALSGASADAPSSGGGMALDQGDDASGPQGIPYDVPH